jgi:hypothetical protein
MKDLASAISSPPAEFTVDSYLMRNCLEFLKPLYFGRDTFDHYFHVFGLKTYETTETH